MLMAALPARAAARLVTDQTGRRVNVPDHPRRLISLAPSITEIIYALDASDELVGDTDYCDYPPQAKLKPHVGELVNPNLERIVALKPDLVFGTAEANRRETADQLARLGIPLYGLTAHNLDQTLVSIADVGEVLGRQQAAQGLVGRLRARIDAVEKRVAGEPRVKVLFVVWYRPLITAGPHTFISDVIHRAGGISLGDDLRGEWPRLSLEVALQRDPDVILIPKTAAFSPSLAEFKKLPGWKELRAVKDGRLYFIPETILRPSPRLVDALEEVATVLHPTKSVAPRPSR
jgi:iron complex transport system substrate-binding protein